MIRPLFPPLALALLFLTIGLSGCASSRAVVSLSGNYGKRPVRRVALVQIADYPAWPGSGEIAAGTFEAYLLGAGYSVVERRQIDKILKEQKFSLSGSLDAATIRKLGRVLGVDALAFGGLTDFSNIREQTVLVNLPLPRSDPLFGQIVTVERHKNTTVQTVQNVVTGYHTGFTNAMVPRTETLPARAGLSVRLVDAASGEVLWSASASAGGPDLTTATQEASSKLIKGVTQRLKRVAILP